ncbi:NADH dehydrogenase (ubiquinone) complex I, assembly factor 6-like [Argiope bruennichi]|uniref:NADH dehydrogenase (ubiquinone) complex I, assembly factor 6-like n=1 Tax=Argiope bruennichi TaxID=94029 RepID=UPI002494F3A4|nr:NADH dehydrogenase (ubiquinone) complex I, assembly factor 6-like [Argiope bruennichi]
MAAPMRIIFNNSDTFVKGILKFDVGKLAPTFFANPSTVSYNERRISTKKFDSYQYCQEVVRKYDYENYLCTLLLSEPVKSAAFAVRAFNVEIAQVRDSVSTSTIGEMRMKFWKDALDKTYNNNPPEQPVIQELAKVINRVKLSKSWLLRLIASRESLLTDKPFVSVKDLENYCDQAVVSIYYLILQASGISDVHCDHAASHIGKSQGIGNFLRGIPFNASRGRLFLPLEIMSKHKISQEMLFHADQKKKLQDAVFELSTVAHQHLKLARKLSPDLPKQVKRIFLPAVATETYLKTLEETDFDVFHPKNQRRNNLLAFHLWLHKLRNTY